MKIEKNVPVPTKKKTLQQDFRDALAKMEVGDSVLINHNRYNYLMAVASNMRVSKEIPYDYKLIGRQDEEKPTKTRIWRVK